MLQDVMLTPELVEKLVKEITREQIFHDLKKEFGLLVRELKEKNIPVIQDFIAFHEVLETKINPLMLIGSTPSRESRAIFSGMMLKAACLGFMNDLPNRAAQVFLRQLIFERVTGLP